MIYLENYFVIILESIRIFPLKNIKNLVALIIRNCSIVGEVKHFDSTVIVKDTMLSGSRRRRRGGQLKL